MPALVRRLAIWAAVDGLIVQAHGPTEHHKSLHISYQQRQVTELATGADADNDHVHHGTPLEAHGIIGLFTLASSAFLIAITQREQVALIWGKPVYVITDVALLPLTSQGDAGRAISAAAAANLSGRDATSSESDLSDADAGSGGHPNDGEPETPAECRPTQPRASSETSIAKDVIANRGQYGRFAAQWFSKQGWGGTQRPTTPPPTALDHDDNQSSAQTASGEPHAAAVVVAPTAPIDPAPASAPAPATPNQADTKTAHEEEMGPEQPVEAGPTLAGDAMTEALPRILRTTKMILTSRSFFFSYDVDLTRRLALTGGTLKPPAQDTLDPLYFWNRRLALPFLAPRLEAFLMPVLQGFVGQRTFTVQKRPAADPVSACVIAADHEAESAGIEHAISHAKQGLATLAGSSQTYLLTLISRRSVKRSGLRYLRRGIDDDGNCANAVETEQILSAPDWSLRRQIRSFVQIRCSIPLYFSQSPYAFKPLPMLHQSAAKNEAALKRHLQDLKARYGRVQIAVLVDRHGGEVVIGDAYQHAVQSLQQAHQLDDVDFEWFDFHAECRGMKFENVARLVDKLDANLQAFGETVVSRHGVVQSQSGIVRTNCMDCLDRTNVAQSAFGQRALQQALAGEGFDIDLLHDESTTWFNTLWADNGDAISRQYASTAALKGDFTRTRRRNYRGALNDFSLTLTRYYNNMVNDYFSQAVIDVLLGNMSGTIFEDLESTIMSADPGISIEQVREAAIETCAKQVIQDSHEDLVHGWTMLTPAHDNTLRALPFEEAVILLTDAALYCCRFDRTTEKLASFEKVDLRSIDKIRHGTYVTSTFSERQMREDLNAGVVVSYRPGRNSMIRTNTRSLQNYVPPPLDGPATRIDGGTGIMSWLTPSPAAASRTLAVKVIPTTVSDVAAASPRPGEMPAAVAENIAMEIRRAVVGSADDGGDGPANLVEHDAIISLAEAKKRTGYFEQLGYSIKKMVWA